MELATRKSVIRVRATDTSTTDHLLFFRIALLVDVIEKKFVIFDFWLVVVVANIGGCFLEFACVKNNATIADQRAS